MDVIRHHYISVQGAQAPGFYSVQLFRDQACDLGPAKVDGSAAAHVQQPIKCDKGLARSGSLASENTLLREASQETPCDKDG
jgi:hypothetical protein